jgi:hypothetical protein
VSLSKDVNDIVQQELNSNTVFSGMKLPHGVLMVKMGMMQMKLVRQRLNLMELGVMLF